MGGLWKFLRQDRNRQILGWLGGGLVVVVAGLWAVFVYLHPPQRGDVPRPSVSASQGGVAIGGNVTGATITGGTTAPK